MKIDIMWPVRGLLRVVGLVASNASAHADQQHGKNQDDTTTKNPQQNSTSPILNNPLQRCSPLVGTPGGDGSQPAPIQVARREVPFTAMQIREKAAVTPKARIPQPKSPVECSHTAAFEPKVFDRSPRAARMPWLLPMEPSASGIAADQARIGDLDVRAVSIVGPNHRCEEPAVPRQDSYRLGRDHAGRYLIIAVADGMSDSLRSDLGATVAARCAVDTLRTHLDSGVDPSAEMMQKVFRTSAGIMVAAAQNAGLSENDVRCALIVAVIPTRVNSRSGRRRAWFATLADVSAWLRFENGWQHLAGDKKKSDLDRNGLHHFLPYHPDHVVTVSHELEQGATVAVVTDGVGDAFTDVPNAANWFAQRWRMPVPLESFLLDVGYQASAQVDDRTSVTVWCGAGSRSSQ